MIKLIIFDWDDVFTQGSIKGYYKCYHEALVGVGVHLDPEVEDERIKAKWGAGHPRQLAYLLQEHPELVDEAIKIYRENLFGNTFVDCLSLVPGSREFLQGLSKDYYLAVATGAHPKILRDHLLPKWQLDGIFDKIITIYDLDKPEYAKPHPHILQKIMKEAGMSAEETIMVGDAASDVQMARNAGIDPVVVLTGHLDRQEAEELKVRHIIDKVTLLRQVLNEKDQ